METRAPSDWVLGIDFGGTHTKAVLLDGRASVTETIRQPSAVRDGPDAALTRLVRVVERAQRRSAEADGRLVAVGLAVCGPVDYRVGSILQSPVLPGWRDVPLAPALAERTGIRVCVENDASAAILGEWWRGAGRGQPVVAGMTLGTGIGGGLVIDGRVFRGSGGFAGEFGHVAVAAEPVCACGGRGCLGAVASATATLRCYQDLGGAPPVRGVRDLASRAARGDPLAVRAIGHSVEYLAQATLALVNALNPNVFVFAGGMAQLGETLLDPVRRRVRSSTFEGLAATTRIEVAELGDLSGSYGAAYLALVGDGGFP